MEKNLKIAIVYDWLDKWGGVERVLLNLHEIFPKAVFFTSYFDRQEAYWAKDFKIKTSFIQKLPNFIKKNRLLSMILFPYAFESFDFSNYDLVISVTSSFAKAVITRPETTHICYILTPTRYFYYPETYLTTTITKLGYLLLPGLKAWDAIAARRPDHLVSISDTVRKRVKRFYSRNSQVIYPPFDLEYWKKVDLKVKKPVAQLPENFYLIVSRLEHYKRIEIAIEAFNKSGKNLVVIGKGTQLPRLKNLARENVFFISDIKDDELAWFYKNARALIMPQEEEFGYTALEAQYFDCPVIAFGRGGATETILNQQTGLFFERQTSKSLIESVERYETIEYNLRKTTRKLGKENVRLFSRENFEKQFKQFIESKVNL